MIAYALSCLVDCSEGYSDLPLIDLLQHAFSILVPIILFWSLCVYLILRKRQYSWSFVLIIINIGLLLFYFNSTHSVYFIDFFGMTFCPDCIVGPNDAVLSMLKSFAYKNQELSLVVALFSSLILVYRGSRFIYKRVTKLPTDTGKKR